MAKLSNFIKWCLPAPITVLIICSIIVLFAFYPSFAYRLIERQQNLSIITALLSSAIAIFFEFIFGEQL